MSEDETFVASPITTGAVDLPATTLTEEETLSTGPLDTGAVVIQFANFSQGNNLSGDNITTGAPIVPAVIKYGDHLFYMEELVSGNPVLGAPFWNPNFARVVDVANKNIGTQTLVNSSNKVKVG